MLFNYCKSNILLQPPLPPCPTYCRRWRYTWRLRFAIQQYRLLTYIFNYVITQLLQRYLSFCILQILQQIECKDFTTRHKKKRGIRLLSFHDLRLSHCPSNKTTTRSPRRYVIYIYTTTWRCNNMHPPRRYVYNTPVGHLTLLCSY